MRLPCSVGEVAGPIEDRGGVLREIEGDQDAPDVDAHGESVPQRGRRRPLFPICPAFSVASARLRPQAFDGGLPGAYGLRPGDFSHRVGP